MPSAKWCVGPSMHQAGVRPHPYGDGPGDGAAGEGGGQAVRLHQMRRGIEGREQ